MDRLVGIWREARAVERAAYAVGAVLFAWGLVNVLVLLVTGGSWEGPLSLRKAATFGLSFGLTLVAVAWATSFARIGPRRLLLGLFGGASVGEVVLVSVQAWRGVPSHFNFETPVDTAISMTLAAGGGVLILTAVAFTATAVAGTRTTSPTMRVAVRFGLVTLLAALGTGAAMIARGVVSARTGDPQIAYTTAGALKPLHAVAMHGILVLPALAWLLDSTSWSPRRRMALVWAGVGAYTALTVIVGVESLTGVSPLAPPVVVGIASGLALAVLTVVGVVALYGVRAKPAAL
ncbi:hypothetical protein [Actinokineospora sp. NBRC 105648]|uniref:hypothetical protein n=1 Tax=Actinokineospora sp. NBRC 105648 TaxID=3032206 RepID=UPI0024A05FDA|nr:hypothetical protein [Actinokineospora sp. NBRC 105648]GLZ39051.1 hypothetical protein Acsp05_26750 [Actinokineospora sp. NBRC 105648]